MMQLENSKIWMLGAALTAAAGALAYAGLARNDGKPAARLAPQTRQHLLNAMHGEAFAYAKYMLYAEQARRGGNQTLAELFEKTARVERFEHFAEEARLAGLAGSNEANLREAIQGENYETTIMYPQYAQAARAAGDTAAARRFQEIRNDEMRHRDAFEAALKRLSRRASR